MKQDNTYSGTEINVPVLNSLKTKPRLGCPKCKGRGEFLLTVRVFNKGHLGQEFDDTMKCKRCKGEGTIEA